MTPSFNKEPRQNDGSILYGIDGFYMGGERMLREVLFSVKGELSSWL